MGPLQAAGKQQSLEEKRVDVNQEPDPPQTRSAMSGDTTDGYSGFPLSVTEVLTLLQLAHSYCASSSDVSPTDSPLPPKIKNDSEPALKGAAYKLQTSGVVQKEPA